MLVSSTTIHPDLVVSVVLPDPMKTWMKIMSLEASVCTLTEGYPRNDDFFATRTARWFFALITSCGNPTKGMSNFLLKITKLQVLTHRYSNVRKVKWEFFYLGIRTQDIDDICNSCE